MFIRQVASLKRCRRLNIAGVYFVFLEFSVAQLRNGHESSVCQGDRRPVWGGRDQQDWTWAGDKQAETNVC